MTPVALSLAVFVIEEAIKLEPAFAAELKSIFSKDTVSADDLAALRAKILGETYENLTGTTISDAPGNVPVNVISLPVAASAPAPAVAAPVTCAKCGQVLIPDHPDNCSCV